MFIYLSEEEQERFKKLGIKGAVCWYFSRKMSDEHKRFYKENKRKPSEYRMNSFMRKIYQLYMVDRYKFREALHSGKIVIDDSLKDGEIKAL